LVVGKEMIMKIFVNDKQVEAAEGLLLSDLIKQFDYQKYVAIINGKHILLKDYSSRILIENDNVKLVRILGGG
jgi:sulfur carrier protein